MQLDKLQLDLRPRTNARALDLGFALLHSYAATTYLVWLTLWLPVVIACCALTLWDPRHIWGYLFLLWWLRALPERGPLYVLSRRVFGEDVNWQGALKAWPSQLGGWISMLTWRRLISPMRSLFAPIWQLEGARGGVASERRRVIGRNGTFWAAVWFGVAMFLFELVLTAGFLGFISIFLGRDEAINPFALSGAMFVGGETGSWYAIVLFFVAYGFATAVIGPFFVACGFTLYLNRRATLEAWDIEIALRQIQSPRARDVAKKAAASGFMALAAGLLMFLCGPAESVHAAENPPAKTNQCEPPLFVKNRANSRLPDADDQQAKVRKQLASLYDSDDLRGYSCIKESHLKGFENKPDEPKKNDDLRKIGKPWDLSLLATVLEVVFISAAICLVLWLIYRFRDSFSGFARKRPPPRATEVAGLDIRPESLPDDVPTQVMKLWHQGQKRLALALLYRATISRLVHDDGLTLSSGATEGDCTREAEKAFRNVKLSAGRLKASATATQLWLRAAYADSWPDDAAVQQECKLWGEEFAPTVKGYA